MRIAEHSADLIRLASMAIAVVLSVTGAWKFLTSFDLIALAATIIGGYPMAKEAFEAIRERRMTMELSMSIAVLATLMVGQFLTGLVITLFVLIAELLEDLTVASGRNVIRSLLDLLPRRAFVRRNGTEIEVDSASLQIGDLVIIKPGEKIPVDGRVVKGNSFVDQSSITGESLPSEKTEGVAVYAGTINQSGVLEVETRQTGKDTTFGKIVEIIERAEKNRAPIQKTADRLAARLVYFAFAGAIITYIVTHNIMSSISALIVAGACGVAAGTPLAILAGIGRTAKEGIVVKGGIYLEQLAKVGTVVLDKTGTLTLGVPVVVDVTSFDGSVENVVRTAAIAEQHSEHPLASAILKKAKELTIDIPPYTEMNYIPGRGILCKADGSEILVGNRTLLEDLAVRSGNGIDEHIERRSAAGETSILVALDKSIVGVISVADILRADSKQAVSELKKLGCRVILLSGDSKNATEAIGKSLAVDEVFGEMLPAQKVKKVKELVESGSRVAMVGDGVNDAAAIVEASVGIAMGTGTDIATESAGMVLMTNDLTKIVEAMKVSRQCFRVITFNFWGTVLVDTAGIILAFLSFINPMGAALIHVGSEMTFILNSARLFRRNRES